MINYKTLKINKSNVNKFTKRDNFTKQYGVSKTQFNQMIEEAQDDVENGRLYTHAEVMNMGLELLENRILELSEEDRVEARMFIAKWRNTIIE